MKDLVKQFFKKYITDNQFVGFSVFVTVICLLNIILNVINSRFYLSDFKVYYMAAKTIITGGYVYLVPFSVDSGVYKYSPVILFFFLPYCIFNYSVASVIHIFILSFAFWYTFMIIRKIFTIYFPEGTVRHEGWLLSLSFLCILIHLVRELYLGNINILLLMFCVLAIRNYLAGKPIAGSILLGIVILTKPFFLILIIPLVFRKHWEALSWLSFVLFAGWVLPFLVLGFDRTFSLYSAWFETMQTHDQDFPGMNSLDYILQYYFSHGLSNYATYIIILIVGLALSCFTFLDVRKEGKSSDMYELAKKNFVFEWFLIVALIPNIVKTDSEHFLSTAPIFVFLIYYIGSQRKYWMIPVMIILIFFYGGNSSDLLGKELSQKLFSMGLLGISNILILLLSLFIYNTFRKKRTFIRDKEGAFA